MFAIGLFKKLILADNVAPFADGVFDGTAAGLPVGASLAWIGALAYTLQLYFDFSGYSDMAIGLALMLNIRLPVNFNSPYKATGIIDFWRRWHITLGRFLRDYLYIGLGGNRRGPRRRFGRRSRHEAHGTIRRSARIRGRAKRQHPQQRHFETHARLAA